MDVVFRYSDRIVMMHEGRFLADGTPEEIKANKDVANICSACRCRLEGRRN